MIYKEQLCGTVMLDKKVQKRMIKKDKKIKNRPSGVTFEKFMYIFMKNKYPEYQFSFICRSDYEKYNKRIKNINSAWWLSSLEYDFKAHKYNIVFKEFIAPKGEICSSTCWNEGDVEFRPSVIIRKINLLKVGQSFSIGNYSYTIFYRNYHEYCAICDTAIKSTNLKNYKKVCSEDIVKELNLLPR